MRRGTTVAVILAAMLGFALVSAGQDAFAQPASQAFQFKFTPGQPLTYAMTTRMKMDMDMKTAKGSAKTKIDVKLQCNVKLAPQAAAKPGVTTCTLSTSDIDGDWDISGPAGNIVLKLRGAQMTGTHNGTVIIDTEKDIGTAQAKDFKKEIAALYLSGQMDLDNRGSIKDIRGETPFVEFWKEANEASVGFFGIVFPDKPVAAGGTWTEKVSLKKMGEILLEGEGLRCTVTFTRQPDTTVQGRPAALFKLSAPFAEKDLVGTLQQMGQKTKLSIPAFRRTATGTVEFDQAKGVLIDSETKIDANASMNANIQGQDLKMDMVIGAEIGLKLAPPSPVKTPKAPKTP
jgi:hypothetical protein